MILLVQKGIPNNSWEVIAYLGDIGKSVELVSRRHGGVAGCGDRWGWWLCGGVRMGGRGR